MLPWKCKTTHWRGFKSDSFNTLIWVEIVSMKGVLESPGFKLGMQTGSRVRCTERFGALREERGRLDRAGGEREREWDKKRKNNLSTPSLIFIQARESSFASRASTPPLSLIHYYPSPLPLPLLLPIPFQFFPLIMTSLFSSPASPTVSITAEQQGSRKAAELVHKITTIKREIHPKAIGEASGDTPPNF